MKSIINTLAATWRLLRHGRTPAPTPRPAPQHPRALITGDMVQNQEVWWAICLGVGALEANGGAHNGAKAIALAMQCSCGCGNVRLVGISLANAKFLAEVLPRAVRNIEGDEQGEA